MIENGDFVTRRADGSLSDGREPLDLEALFGSPNAGMIVWMYPSPAKRDSATSICTCAMCTEAVDFYHGVLGFDVMGLFSIFQAAFVSAGGYHHHIGLNTWQGAGAPPPPAEAAGLRYFQHPAARPADPGADRRTASGGRDAGPPDG